MDIDTIYNMDCLEGMKDIPDGSIDAIICDLPYGTTACAWDSVIPMEPHDRPLDAVVTESALYRRNETAN